MPTGIGTTTEVISPKFADKFMYFWKRDSWPKSRKPEVMGLQGASSGTNTRTASNVQTKTVTLKSLGAKTQQRVVNLVYTQNDSLYRELNDAWSKGEVIHLWRVDFNTLQGTKPNRSAEAEYSQCLVPQLPITEGIGAITQSNATFEVQGEAVDDEDGKPARVTEDDLVDGSFDVLDKALYAFSHGQDVGDNSATTNIPDESQPSDNTASNGSANTGK
ncbi:hypothetical protein [Lactiplantibacillus plantarum]|jgi:hypothetical protein|uniref:hypothetical protein n=1 Tax=Lactiplantibacillus plantarum TaxID=1590 RepID=UPI0009785BA2|nr:hypothetical protein [Lactiplantibacillus plantarum]MDX3785521.1 hypothetical protein [Lactiplantibacillus plantarum]MDX3811393.1 hypothetical protein [Lactiplantibacillus plantarum]MDX3856415.1 hypothetical protein [Lactiplantibacillus plantarum]